MFEIRLLTLNTHSLVESDYENKLEYFADAIERIRPDIIALQEVNQSISADIIDKKQIVGGTFRGNIPLKADNHIFRTAEMLRERGIEYNWVWLGIKRGYDKYDEGIAMLSLEPIEMINAINLSETDNYENWKTRKSLGIKVNNEWFYSVHFNWWNDKDEPFLMQWAKMMKEVADKETVWLMGDFNNPSDKCNEGYDIIRNFGWYDTFLLAKKKDSGYTAESTIDGWKVTQKNNRMLRIDYIFCNKKRDIISSQTIFNGINEPVISDHYGIICEY